MWKVAPECPVSSILSLSLKQMILPTTLTIFTPQALFLNQIPLITVLLLLSVIISGKKNCGVMCTKTETARNYTKSCYKLVYEQYFLLKHTWLQYCNNCQWIFLGEKTVVSYSPKLRPLGILLRAFTNLFTKTFYLLKYPWLHYNNNWVIIFEKKTVESCAPKLRPHVILGCYKLVYEQLFLLNMLWLKHWLLNDAYSGKAVIQSDCRYR